MITGIEILLIKAASLNFKKHFVPGIPFLSILFHRIFLEVSEFQAVTTVVSSWRLIVQELTE